MRRHVFQFVSIRVHSWSEPQLRHQFDDGRVDCTDGQLRIDAEHKHQPEFESFTFSSEKTFSRDRFERFADRLPVNMHRAKGFVLFPDGAQLFNFVAGRWDLEPFETDRTDLVFIGKEIAAQKPAILRALDACAHPDNK